MIESSEEPNLETLLDKLKSKIVHGYSSIRQAFLVFDEVSFILKNNRSVACVSFMAASSN